MRINVITYCTGYPYEIYERFAGSLYDTGFSGKLFFIISPNEIQLLHKLRIEYPNVFFFVDTSTPSTHLNCHRFFVYQYLFQHQAFDVDLLLLCDSRDVLFQKNIEEYPYSDDIDLYAFQEGVLLKNETLCNVPWIQILEIYMDTPILEHIKDNPVICCGTTIAKVPAMIRYVDTMCHILDTYQINMNLDQGIHNYLLYMNKLGLRIKYMENKDHLVNTVACDTHLVNELNKIVTSDGEVSYIVHQYDRFSDELKQKISIKYNFTI